MCTAGCLREKTSRGWPLASQRKRAHLWHHDLELEAPKAVKKNTFLLVNLLSVAFCYDNCSKRTQILVLRSTTLL